MFYYIYEILNFNIFQYITVRAGIAFFIAFILTAYLMPKFIAWAKAKNAAKKGQNANHGRTCLCLYSRDRYDHLR